MTDYAARWGYLAAAVVLGARDAARTVTALAAVLARAVLVPRGHATVGGAGHDVQNRATLLR